MIFKHKYLFNTKLDVLLNTKEQRFTKLDVDSTLENACQHLTL
jgi:hypothetical protein